MSIMKNISQLKQISIKSDRGKACKNMYTLEILGVYKIFFHACGILHTLFVKPYIQIARLKAIWLFISFYQSLLILKRKILFQVLSPIITLYLLFRRKFSVSWVSLCSIVYLSFFKSYSDHLFIFF